MLLKYFQLIEAFASMNFSVIYLNSFHLLFWKINKMAISILILNTLSKLPPHVVAHFQKSSRLLPPAAGVLLYSTENDSLLKISTETKRS